MCRIIKKIDRKTVTVYKVAVLVKNELFSISTGVHYQPGADVSRPRKQRRLCQWFAEDLIEPSQLWTSSHIKKFYGKTSGFISLESAYRMANVWKPATYAVLEIVVIEMQLSKNLILGDYQGRKIYAGEHIDSIRVIKSIGYGQAVNYRSGDSIKLRLKNGKRITTSKF